MTSSYSEYLVTRSSVTSASALVCVTVEMTALKKYREKLNGFDTFMLWKSFTLVLLLVVILDTYTLLRVIHRLEKVEQQRHRRYNAKKNRRHGTLQMDQKLATTRMINVYEDLKSSKRDKRSLKNHEASSDKAYVHIPVSYFWKLVPSVCSENKTVLCLSGEKGEKGEKGNDGHRGKHGPKGHAGSKGLKGDPGQTGQIGPIGPKGRAGERGSKGEKGESGNDVTAPTITEPPKSVSAVEGHNVTFMCDAKGNPIPKITWSFNGRSSTQRYKVIGQNGLIIYRVQKEDHGTIKCMAHNLFGRQESVANLSILMKPKTKIVQDFGGILYENGEAIAKCMSSGNPKPHFKWRKAIGSLPSTAKLSENGQTLKIKRLQKIHTGTYVCSAVNDLGSSESTVFLYVLSDIDKCLSNVHNCDANATCSNSPGTFTCTCNNGYTGQGTSGNCKDINECSTAIHDCDSNAACANTPGSFRCTCNNGYAGGGTSGDCKDINECTAGTHNCDTYAVCSNTQGNFTCECNSGFIGNGTAGNCGIKPKAQIVKGFEEILYVGGNAIAKCNSMGHPKPGFKWTKLWDSLPSTAKVSNGGKTLTLKQLKVSDAGTYVCSAFNELGSSKIAVFLHISLPSECTSYAEITDSSRRAFSAGGSSCDSSIVKKWYRFKLPGANITMLESCIPKNRCGTEAVGWLRTKHPSVADGIVNGDVCFHWGINCCTWRNSIRIRNCDGYFVYELQPTSKCHLRYCTT